MFHRTHVYTTSVVVLPVSTKLGIASSAMATDRWKTSHLPKPYCEASATTNEFLLEIGRFGPA